MSRSAATGSSVLTHALVRDVEWCRRHCWGVDNNTKGTNTNRVVVFRKPAP